jgi:lipoprotein-anchoring transpeptidase ErfK/SrfK
MTNEDVIDLYNNRVSAGVTVVVLPASAWSMR